MKVEHLKQSLETALAKVVLFTVDSLPTKVGFDKLIGVLRGAKSSYITDLEFDQVPTYGSLPMFSDTMLTVIVKKLIEKHYLELKESRFSPTIAITESGRHFLEQHKAENFSYLDSFAENRIRRMTDTQGILFLQLKKLRLKFAKTEGIAPFMICTDAQLRELVTLLPMTKEEITQIKGLKENFAAKYASDFIRIIKTWKDLETISS